MTNLRKKARSSTDQMGHGEFDYQQCSFLSESDNFQIAFFFSCLASFYTKPHQFSKMIILIYTGFKSKGTHLINAKLCLDVGYDKYIILSNFGGFIMSGFEVIVITEPVWIGLCFVKTRKTD